MGVGSSTESRPEVALILHPQPAHPGAGLAGANKLLCFSTRDAPPRGTSPTTRIRVVFLSDTLRDEAAGTNTIRKEFQSQLQSGPPVDLLLHGGGFARTTYDLLEFDNWLCGLTNVRRKVLVADPDRDLAAVHLERRGELFLAGGADVVVPGAAGADSSSDCVFQELAGLSICVLTRNSEKTRRAARRGCVQRRPDILLTPFLGGPRDILDGDNAALFDLVCDLQPRSHLFFTHKKRAPQMGTHSAADVPELLAQQLSAAAGKLYSSALAAAAAVDPVREAEAEEGHQGQHATQQHPRRPAEECANGGSKLRPLGKSAMAEAVVLLPPEEPQLQIDGEFIFFPEWSSPAAAESTGGLIKISTEADGASGAVAEDAEGPASSVITGKSGLSPWRATRYGTLPAGRGSSTTSSSPGDLENDGRESDLVSGEPAKTLQAANNDDAPEESSLLSRLFSKSLSLLSDNFGDDHPLEQPEQEQLEVEEPEGSHRKRLFSCPRALPQVPLLPSGLFPAASTPSASVLCLNWSRLFPSLFIDDDGHESSFRELKREFSTDIREMRRKLVLEALNMTNGRTLQALKEYEQTNNELSDAHQAPPSPVKTSTITAQPPPAPPPLQIQEVQPEAEVISGGFLPADAQNEPATEDEDESASLRSGSSGGGMSQAGFEYVAEGEVMSITGPEEEDDDVYAGQEQVLVLEENASASGSRRLFGRRTTCEGESEFRSKLSTSPGSAGGSSNSCAESAQHDASEAEEVDVVGKTSKPSASRSTEMPFPVSQSIEIKYDDLRAAVLREKFSDASLEDLGLEAEERSVDETPSDEQRCANASREQVDSGVLAKAAAAATPEGDTLSADTVLAVPRPHFVREKVAYFEAVEAAIRHPSPHPSPISTTSSSGPSASTFSSSASSDGDTRSRGLEACAAQDKGEIAEALPRDSSAVKNETREVEPADIDNGVQLEVEAAPRDESEGRALSAPKTSTKMKQSKLHRYMGSPPSVDSLQVQQSLRRLLGSDKELYVPAARVEGNVVCHTRAKAVATAHRVELSTSEFRRLPTLFCQNFSYLELHFEVPVAADMRD